MLVNTTFYFYVDILQCFSAMLRIRNCQNPAVTHHMTKFYPTTNFATYFRTPRKKTTYT